MYKIKQKKVYLQIRQKYQEFQVAKCNTSPQVTQGASNCTGKCRILYQVFFLDELYFKKY
jgi:hypothetical protein